MGSQIQNGHQPQISINNGIILKSLQNKSDVVDNHLRVSRAKHIQKHLNETLMTDINGFFVDENGEYGDDDYDDDEEELKQSSDVDLNEDEVSIATSTSWKSQINELEIIDDETVENEEINQSQKQTIKKE